MRATIETTEPGIDPGDWGLRMGVSRETPTGTRWLYMSSGVPHCFAIRDGAREFQKKLRAEGAL